jgi:hypothetical protein
LIQGLNTDLLEQFKRGEPIYQRKPIPTFRTEYERDKYYDNKKKIWIEGANGLTGMHIYYLDEMYLFNRVTGQTYYPICRDIDVLIFHRIEELRKIFRWLYITKGRGIGLSTIMFTIPHWFFRMYPGSKCVATTGKDKTTLGTLFSNYFMHAYNNMDELIRPMLINKNETKSESYLKMQIKTKKEGGEIELRTSEFVCKETSDNPKSPTAFSGYGAIYGGLDEVPLHPRREELLKSAIEIFTDPLTKEIKGFCLGGGTVEDVLTAEDIVKLKNFIDNCGALNFEHAFIPATWGNCMTNGWSDIKQAEEKILKKREELDQMEDKSFLKAYTKNNPLTLDEIFEMGGSGKFEEDVIAKVRITLKSIKNIEQPRYDLVDINGNIITNPSTKSPIILLEQPKEGVAYKIGNDGTGSTKDSGVIDGSDVAMVVTKMFDPSDEQSSYTPVAYYAERPSNFENSYIKQTNMIKLYNKFDLAKVRLQANQANEHFGAHLTKEGLGKILGFRHDLGGVAKENKNKMGTYVTDDIIEWQYRQANRVLRKYGQNFKLKRLLEEILMPYETNTDVLDAWLMSLIEMGIDFDKPVVKKAPPVRVVYENRLKSDGTFERVPRKLTDQVLDKTTI